MTPEQEAITAGRISEYTCLNLLQSSPQWLHTYGVPVDYSGFKKLRDLVPRVPKLKDYTTPEFAPRKKSDANYAHQNLKQRFPTGGPSRTTQSHPLPFESGGNVLPGMEHVLSMAQRVQVSGQNRPLWGKK